MKTIYPGQIVLWNTAFGATPNGWHLCDGTDETPDLRNKFIVGAGNSYAPDDEGGSANHAHAFTSDGHFHNFEAGTDLQGGANNAGTTTTEAESDTTGVPSQPLPYYAVVYIIKL